MHTVADARYERRRGKLAHSRLLHEFCAMAGWSANTTLKVMSGRRRGGRGRGGAPRRYEGKMVEVLTHCWREMEQPCGKRMTGMLPLGELLLGVAHTSQGAGEPVALGRHERPMGSVALSTRSKGS